MMLSLPLITPRDSHELWFGFPQPYRTSSQYQTNGETQGGFRRNGNNTMNVRPFVTSATTGNVLSSLVLEERALRARKNNIASFGYSWIKPAGCTKTMLGMKEEEAEREEALAAAAAEMAAATTVAEAEAGAAGINGLDPQHDGQDDTGMERDLDDDIPDADAEGLVEEGEEGLEEDDVVDEEGYMERDLDDDIPEAFPDDDDDDHQIEDDFNNQPDLDDDIPSAGDMDDEVEDMSEEDMGRDLDDDIPEAAENQSDQEDEWQHTDTDAELDDEDEASFSHDQNLPASTASIHGLPPAPVRVQETEAQRRFLQRWSGGGDVFDTSGMMIDEDDLRASVTSQGSRRSFFSRFPRRRAGGPRDSFD
ncbi:Apc15p protein-domain-containing protein [Aspergillus pseudotamarii]|uniref:Apc15p protein-domain-containing protein n=1 Tax=Aspergillus pseudotamarii TaxID=132259 RepID=A0A5N6SKY8_ASPPS|nr:Apc15p protein-domain-containing protein [Aspergillus pseudotamarii]KAE8134053.1 Apc15p protein-domain-containing protein [Aspergillus pseudotamarii]